MKSKRYISLLRNLLSGIIAVSNYGCGGGSASTPPPPPPPISVGLTPSTAQSVDQGQTVNFTATVMNDSSSKGVKWSLSGTGCMGAACGALSNQTATTATYIAPSPVAANVSVSLTATSAADSTKSASDSVTVFPPPTVTTTSLQNATGGSAYNVTLQESGGIAPFTWSLASGSSLPAGLSLDSNGTISGTPTAGGLFNFTVQVADSANPPVATTAKLSLTVVILPPSPVPATVSGTIEVGTAPSAIAVDPSSNKVYVADFGTQPGFGPQACSPTGADVTVIDGATESATAVPLSSAFQQLNPVGIALNLASHTVYVVVRENTPNLTVQSCTHVIDGIELVGTSTPINNRFIYQAITELSDMDINQVTGDIYVGHTFAYVSSIVVIGGNGVVATISVGSNFSGCTGDNLCLSISVAVNANTNKIYVAKRGSNSISVIDGVTNSVTTTITDPSAVAPVAIAVNSRTNTIYVANAGSHNLTVINGATGSVTATVPVGTSPSGVAVDEQTNFIYVANAGNSQTGKPGNVTVIDGTTSATTTVSDPKAINPVAVAVNSVTNKIYVANSGSNNVTVINGAHD